MGVFDKFIGIIGKVAPALPGVGGLRAFDTSAADAAIKKKLEEESKASIEAAPPVPLGGGVTTQNSSAVPLGGGNTPQNSEAVPLGGAIQPQQSLINPVAPPVDVNTQMPAATVNEPIPTTQTLLQVNTPSYAETREPGMGTSAPSAYTPPATTEQTNKQTEQLVGGLLRTGQADLTGLQPAAPATQQTEKQPPRTPAMPATLPPSEAAKGITPETSFVQPGAPGQPTMAIGPTQAARQAEVNRQEKAIAARFPAVGKMMQPSGPITVGEPMQPSTAVTYRPFETVTFPKAQTVTVNGQQLGLATKDGKGVVVDKYGTTVSTLEDLERGVYNGKRTAVVGNDVVDLQGNKITDLATAFGDRNFRYEYTLSDIKRREEEALRTGRNDLLPTLDKERAQARLTYLSSPGEAPKRSLKNILKTAGIGALRGFATGGIGGAIGGAAAGGIGAAISPKIGENIMTNLYRIPNAQAQLADATAREKAVLEAQKGRTLNLKEQQELNNAILEGRKRNLESNPYWQRFSRGERLTQAEIAAMESQLGYKTGLRADVAIGEQTEVHNGVVYGKAKDGSYRQMTDEKGNPIFDLTKTVVKVVNPNTGAVTFLTSEAQARAEGTWALEAWKAQIKANIAAAKPPAGALTPVQIRGLEDQIASAQTTIDMNKERIINFERQFNEADRSINALISRYQSEYKKGPLTAEIALEQGLITGEDRKKLEQFLRDKATAESNKKVAETQNTNLQGSIKRWQGTLSQNPGQASNAETFTPEDVDAVIR
jgi:hypothetical protein